MEDDDLLYSGLPNYSHHKNIEELESSQKQLEELVSSLKEQLTKLTAENEELSKKCSTLSKNISSVIKTARNEIKRKDNRISELNKEILFLKTKGKSKVLARTSACELEQRVRDRKRHDFEREEKIVKMRGRERSQSRLRDNLSSRRRKRSGDREDGSSGRKRHCDSSKENPSEGHIDNSLTLRNDAKDDILSDTFTESVLSNQVSCVQSTSSVIDKNDCSLNSSNLKQQSAENKVPNIPMYTLYSQRMFRKLYNIDQPKKTESYDSNDSRSKEASPEQSDIGVVPKSNIDMNLNQNSSIKKLDNSANLVSPSNKLDSAYDLRPKEPQLLIDPYPSVTFAEKKSDVKSSDESSTKLHSDVINSKLCISKPESEILNAELPCTKYDVNDMCTSKSFSKSIGNIIDSAREPCNKLISVAVDTGKPSDVVDSGDLDNKPTSELINSEEPSNKSFPNASCIENPLNEITFCALNTDKMNNKTIIGELNIEEQYAKSKSDKRIAEELDDVSKLVTTDNGEQYNTFKSGDLGSDKPCSKTNSDIDSRILSNNPKLNVMFTNESPFKSKSDVLDPKESCMGAKPDDMNLEGLSTNPSKIIAEGIHNEPKLDLCMKELLNKPPKDDFTKDSLHNFNDELLKDFKQSQTIVPLPSVKLSNGNNDVVTSDNGKMDNQTKLTDFSPILKSSELPSNKVDIQFNIEKNDINSLNVTDVAKNIQVSELKSIISNFNQLTNPDLTKDSIFQGQSSSTTSNVDSNKLKNESSYILPNNMAEGSANPQKHCTMSLGLKLTNRQSKTTFNPISSQWNETCKKIVENDNLSKNKTNDVLPTVNAEHTDNNDGSRKDDLIEALFGSPLKWSENSTEEISPKLCPPASAFEDSCSAQIENAKFKKLSFNTTESVTSKKTVKEIIVSKNSDDISTMTIESRISFQQLKEKRPFEHVNNGKNDKSTVSSYLEATEASDMPSFKVTTLSGSLKSMTSSPIACPKYQDSILGQFDDTTQLISALAKEHSKISPIHTPIKEKKSESPDKKPVANLPLPIEVNMLNVSQNNSVIPKGHPSSRIYKKQEKKTILLDEPINILCPRRKVREEGKNKTSPNKSVRSSPVVCSNSKKQTSDVNNKSEVRISAEKNKLSAENKRNSVEEDRTSKTQYFQTKNQVSGEKQISRSSLGKSSTDRDSQVNYERREIESSSHKVSNEYKLYYDERGRKKVSFTTISSKTSMSNFSPSPRKNNFQVESSRNNRSYSSNKVTFKRPLSFERSHRRSNCVFRETSVERKILRDNRHRIQRTPSRVVRRRDLERNSARATSSHGSKSSTSSSITHFRNHPKHENDHSSKPTHIVRPSKKISWSASTTEVISAQPSQNISSPKTESKMKWVLQPIDLENNQSSVYTRQKEEYQQNTNSLISSQRNTPALSKTSTTPDKEQEKERTPHKSPVVIISRKRPVRFGVSEISAQFFKTVKHE